MEYREAEDRTDLRIVKTRRSIKQAFAALLKEIDYPKITVSAIARRAEINRKTFYLHYRSVDDLLEEFTREEVQCILHSVLDRTQNEDDETFISDLTRTILQTIDERYELSSNVLKSIPLSHMMEMIKHPLFEAVHQLRTQRGLSDIEYSQYYIASYLGAVLSVYQEWKSTGSKETFEKIAGVTATVVLNGFSALL